MTTHIHPTATVPLYGASPALLNAIKAMDINPRRVQNHTIRGDTLELLYTRPSDTTTYFATIDLSRLDAAPAPRP